MRLESRRRFLEKPLHAALGVAQALSIQGSLLASGARSDAGTSGSRFFVRGRNPGKVPFVEEGDFPLGMIVGSGLGGRLALDLSTLTPDSPVTPNNKFFIRTLCPDQLRFTRPWKISVGGLVEAPMQLTLEELVLLAVPLGIHLVECAGNVRAGHFGLISAARWTGIPVAKVLDKVRALPRATRVLIAGFDQHSQADTDSQPGASWIFTLQQLEASGAFFATGMNGAPLRKDHGFPIRLMVPGWYGCACIKWVNEIVLLDDGAPATEQMWEFAGRTHQEALSPFAFRAVRTSPSKFDPVLARDFKAATVDLTAMPVRVERRMVDGKIIYRVAGILWGGDRLTKSLEVRFNTDMPFVPVEDFEHKTNTTWTLWSHTFRPNVPGRYLIQLRVPDKSIRTRRLDAGYYLRAVDITEV